MKFHKFFCELCQLSKQRRISFRALGYRQVKWPLERLFMDIWGLIKTVGRNGERYFLSIIDDYSRRVAVYPLREKSEVFEVVRCHVACAKR